MGTAAKIRLQLGDCQDRSELRVLIYTIVRASKANIQIEGQTCPSRQDLLSSRGCCDIVNYIVFISMDQGCAVKNMHSRVLTFVNFNKVL